MAAQNELKNKFTEEEKYHNLRTQLINEKKWDTWKMALFFPKNWSVWSYASKRCEWNNKQWRSLTRLLFQEQPDLGLQWL